MQLSKNGNIAKYVSKTKNVAKTSAQFVWDGLFNTEVVKSVEPGKTESVSNEEHLKKINYRLLL